jgi:hypothetical protein
MSPFVIGQAGLFVIAYYNRGSLRSDVSIFNLNLGSVCISTMRVQPFNPTSQRGIQLCYYPWTRRNFSFALMGATIAGRHSPPQGSMVDGRSAGFYLVLELVISTPRAYHYHQFLFDGLLELLVLFANSG